MTVAFNSLTMATYRKYQKKSKAPEKGFREFTQDLKNDSIPSVLFMYGKEDYLIKWAVDLIINTFTDPATRSMDSVVIDWKAGMEEEVISSCETFTMLSRKRVVWVRDKDLSAKGEEMLFCRYIQDPSENAILIFSSEEASASNGIVKALRKEKAFYCFDTLPQNELKSFAAKRFREAGVEISNRQLHLLMDATGYRNKDSDYRLYNFDNDIKKILAHAGDGSISDEDIMAAVSGDEDTFIFDLLDGVSGNDKSRAFRIIHNTLSRDPYEVNRVMGQIISQMELMYMVKEVVEDPSISPGKSAVAAKLGIHEFRAEKLMKYASMYTIEKLRRILLSAYRTYGDMLTGAIPPEMAVELFVGEI